MTVEDAALGHRAGHRHHQALHPRHASRLHTGGDPRTPRAAGRPSGHHPRRQRDRPRPRRDSGGDGRQAQLPLGGRVAGQGADPRGGEGIGPHGGGRALARRAHHQAGEARDLRGNAPRAPGRGPGPASRATDGGSTRLRRSCGSRGAISSEAGRSGFRSSWSARTTRCRSRRAAAAFQASSNGLASGNHPLEAICHGLCEVVERDASTLWRLTGDARDRRSVDPSSVTDPQCRGLLARFAAADLAVRIWDTTSDVGVASFCCLVTERSGEFADPEYGNGCHPAREVALAAGPHRGGAGANHLRHRHAGRLSRRRVGAVPSSSPSRCVRLMSTPPQHRWNPSRACPPSPRRRWPTISSGCSRGFG